MTHKGTVEAYVSGVLSGEIPACEELCLACARFREDEACGRWDVDTAEADYVIDKIETQFVHRKGERLDGEPLRGKPLLLVPWQKFCIYGILVFTSRGRKSDA